MIEPEVVFATDFGGDVHAGLELATRLAKERAATLVLMHVVPLSPDAGEGMLYAGLELGQERAERQLRALLPTDPAVPYFHVLEVGNPQERILQFTNRERVDLLVLESRRRSAMRRALQRSLTERLVERASCPVVTYRGSTPFRASKSPVELRAAPPRALETLLNARIDALLIRLRALQRMAEEVAARGSVQRAAAVLERSRTEHGLIGVERTRTELELELGELQRGLGAVGVHVFDRERRPLLAIGTSALDDAAHRELLERARQQGSAVSVPLNANAAGAGGSCVLQAAAHVRAHRFADTMLTLTFDARRDFLRILAQPGPYPSAETYAFDARGLMLSNSRFPDQLRAIGLLPPSPAVQTPRVLRVCDPGDNLLDHRTALSPDCPLTRMAAAATAGRDGCDWRGYRDYRGVEVIGTWRWLSEYGFGVAAEMDRAVAMARS